MPPSQERIKRKTRRAASVASTRCSTMSTVRLTGFTGHPKGERKTGLAVGMDKGHVLTSRDLKPKPSYRKGVRPTLPRVAPSAPCPSRRAREGGT